MIYGTVYGNELTLLAPWLMGQCHLFCFHGTWNQWTILCAGMMHVLLTMNHTSDARRFSGHQANLTKWINEILNKSWLHQVCVLVGGIGYLQLIFWYC